jgi:hypothetical protein
MQILPAYRQPPRHFYNIFQRWRFVQEITTEDNLISAHSPGSPGSIGVDPLDAILPDQVAKTIFLYKPVD